MSCGARQRFDLEGSRVTLRASVFLHRTLMTLRKLIERICRQFLRSLAVAIMCATLALAQDARPTPEPVFVRGGKIETSYDQVKNITTVHLNPLQVYGEPLASTNYKGADEARLYASFTFPGRHLRARPRRVLISLVSTSEDWKYTDYRHAIALVDGERLKLGGLVRLPSFTIRGLADSESQDNTRQEIAISLTLRTFLRIAEGKEVRIRMGPREFKLGANHLGALRELTGTMAR